MEKFLNHLLYSFYLIDKRLFFFQKNPISWSTGKMYTLTGNYISGIIMMLLSIVGLKYLIALGTEYLVASLVAAFILSIIVGLPYYEYHVERKYEEYFKEFQNDTFARKLSWVLISYITLLLSWGFFFLGIVIFMIS